MSCPMALEVIIFGVVSEHRKRHLIGVSHLKTLIGFLSASNLVQIPKQKLCRSMNLVKLFMVSILANISVHPVNLQQFKAKGIPHLEIITYPADCLCFQDTSCFSLAAKGNGPGSLDFQTKSNLGEVDNLTFRFR